MSNAFIQALLMDDPEGYTPPTPSCTPDPYYYNGVGPIPSARTVLSMHFNGTNGSDIFIDSSGYNAKIMTARNGAVLTTTNPKYGSACGFFDGVDDCVDTPVSSDFDFGVGDFCIESWVNLLGNSPVDSGLRVATIASVFPGVSGWSLFINGNGSTTGTGLLLETKSAGVNQNVSVAYSFNKNQWYHVAATRESTVVRLFIDGNLEHTGSVTQGVSNGNHTLQVGRNTLAGGPFSWYLNGTLDDLRITKGAARYTTSFTPPPRQNCDSINDPGVPAIDGQERLTGIAVTATAGTTQVLNPWKKLTGNGTTASAGSVAVFNADRTVALTGQSLTVSSSNLTYLEYPDFVNANVSGLINAISLTPSVNVTVNPDGTYEITDQNSSVLGSGSWIDTTLWPSFSDIASQYRAVSVSQFITTVITEASPQVLSSPFTVSVTYVSQGTALFDFQINIAPTTSNPRYGELGYQGSLRFSGQIQNGV
jgi:hypothetical protein